jgi:hypothetical protein
LLIAVFSSEVQPIYISGGLLKNKQKEYCASNVDTELGTPEQPEEEYVDMV